MDKIWIIKQGNRYRLCRNEREMIRRSSSTSTSQEILEYELTSSSKTSEYFKTKDRDSQLKSILGELDKSEQAIIDLITLYEKLAEDGSKWKMSNVLYTQKEVWLDRLRKYQGDKKGVASILINNKEYFLNISHSVEWLRAVLLCHNFTNHNYDRVKWDVSTKKILKQDTASDELKDNFLIAKQSLRKTKARPKK